MISILIHQYNNKGEKKGKDKRKDIKPYGIDIGMFKMKDFGLHTIPEGGDDGIDIIID